jgi:hypothetical protein
MQVFRRRYFADATSRIGGDSVKCWGPALIAEPISNEDRRGHSRSVTDGKYDS